MSIKSNLITRYLYTCSQKITTLYKCQILWICILLYSLVTFAADDETLFNAKPSDKKNSYPRWPQTSFEWVYHPDHEPEWLLPQQGLELFKNAALTWKDCGLNIKFNGQKTQTEIQSGDQMNSFGWRELPKSMRGVTYRTMFKQSQFIKEADILVNTDNLDIQKNAILLQKVVSHEFGHALGLMHPASCEDVMSNASDCGKKIANPPPLIPTENDLLQCKIRYQR